MLEVTANYTSGFLLAWLVWHLAATPVMDLLWALGYDYGSPLAGFAITALFTIVSVVRSYAWRRVFNRLHSRGIL